MNPFELRGPEFLLFYFCFSLAVIIAILVFRRLAESGDAPRIDLSDPYLIAYLRGGREEAWRVSVISLVDRGMLVMDGRLVRRADNVAYNMVGRPIERAVLEKFRVPGKAVTVLESRNLTQVFQFYQDSLERLGLLPDAAVFSARLMRLLPGLAALAVVGVIKIQIGLSLERPVGFLFMMMIVAIVIAAAISFPRLTARGKSILEDVTNLYSGLRTQVNSFRPGSAPAELTMFAAVFGVAALAESPLGYTQTLFPQTTSSWDSSDGGGGCGGGCGGCGGCGG
jgi:uncharacterized protein (TIGR04222 family)